MSMYNIIFKLEVGTKKNRKTQKNVLPINIVTGSKSFKKIQILVF